jgi:DNA-binding HxlR family transcriptional regulator
MACSIARTLDVVGERWTLLILRDLFVGISRFDAIQDDLGVSRKVLTERLDALLHRGVVEREPYQHNPPRYDYRLTEKGQDLAAVMVAMIAWGDRWEAGDEGPPVLLRHERCGQFAEAVPVCSACGEQLDPAEVTPVPGPGASAAMERGDMPAALARLVEEHAGNLD